MQRGREAEGCSGQGVTRAPAGTRCLCHAVSWPEQGKGRGSSASACYVSHSLFPRHTDSSLRLPGCRMLGPRSLPGPEKTHVLLWLRCKRAPKAAVWCEATSLLLPGRERARCGQQRAAGLALRAQALPREQLRHGAVKELQIRAQPPRWPVTLQGLWCQSGVCPVSHPADPPVCETSWKRRLFFPLMFLGIK